VCVVEWTRVGLEYKYFSSILTCRVVQVVRGIQLLLDQKETRQLVCSLDFPSLTLVSPVLDPTRCTTPNQLDCKLTTLPPLTALSIVPTHSHVLSTSSPGSNH
jgi:hypothetical protein